MTAHPVSRRGETSPKLLDLVLALASSAGLPDLTRVIAAAADLLGELDDDGAAWDSEAG